jgi:hypothetical protein
MWGLVGLADFADGCYTTIDHQTVQDSNPRPCTRHHHSPLLTPKNQRFEPTTMHYCTIDPKIQRFKPTMHYHALHRDRLAPQKSVRTHDHALTAIAVLAGKGAQLRLRATNVPKI